VEIIKMIKIDLQIFENEGVLARAAVTRILNSASEAIAQRGRFSISLAGGSTPRMAYELLAQQADSSKVRWSRVYAFFGDERCVPPDHPESNYRMARLAFLDDAPIPNENIYRMHGELRPATAAKIYNSILRGFFGEGDSTKTFDLLLLGLGTDGHTASMFPGTEALTEQDYWVIPNYVPGLDSWRLTLTYPCLNMAHEVVFMVSGAGKAEILRRVLRPEPGEPFLPAQGIAPQNGRLLWMVDKAAAERL
jgi:6-phosphogluconolactonase